MVSAYTFERSSPARRSTPVHSSAAPSPDQATVRFAPVTSAEEFAALRDEWQELERRSATRFNYFQTFDWNWRWYCNFSDGYDFSPYILTGRRNGALVLVWPAMLTKQAGCVTLKWLTEPHLQYGDALVATDHAPDLLDDAWSFLTDQPDIDLICFGKVLSCANVAATLRRQARHFNASEASQLNLTGFATPDAYMNSLSRSRRKRHTRLWNKLERTGAKLSFQVYEAGPDYRRAVDRAFEMKKTWLTENGLPSQSIFDPTSARFIADLDGGERGTARPVAGVLELDGEPLAVEHGFLFHDRFYAFLGAFDWNHRDLSPGKLLMREMVCWSIENGIDHYDMLGMPAAYKSDWTDEAISMGDYVLARSALAHVYSRTWLEVLRPRAKQLMEGLKPATRRKLLGLARRVRT